MRRGDSVAGAEIAPESAEGVLAGLRIDSERALSSCLDGVPIAGQLSVGVAGDGPPGEGFLAAPGEDGAWLRRDGRRLLLTLGGDWEARVRRLVPYASWLQRLPVLHAAGVARQGSAIALLGASGVGKSSLADRLGRAGHRRLRDDLLPCRASGDGYCVSAPDGTWLPLAALVFLEREERRRPSVEALNRSAAVRRLARDGWGDLQLASLWRVQFDFYVGLAGACRAVRLAMPEGGGRLDESGRQAGAMLAAI